MGTPSIPIHVKLVAGLLSPARERMAAAREELESIFGPPDSRSAPIEFGFTSYYEDEMGQGLMRQYVSFRNLADAVDSTAIKKQTNRLESSLAVEGRRTVNIDPGYLTMTKLVLMSTKDAPSRVYLGEGIYGQPMLIYSKGSYRPWDWTYPDYREASTITFFNEARALYKRQIRSRT